MNELLEKIFIENNITSNQIDVNHRYCVYVTINLINQKFYIGYSSVIENVKKQNYKGSGKRLHYSINKYGWNNFQTFILKIFKTSQEAFEFESLIVNEEFVRSKETYNITLGGKGGWNNWILDEDKLREIKMKQVATQKKNRAAGLTFLTNRLIDDPERNKKFREKLKISQNTKTAKRNHSIASKKNWEDPEYRKKIPKKEKGFKPMLKNGKRIQVYDQEEIQKHLDEGWIVKGYSPPRTEKSIKQLKTSLKKHFSNPKNRKKRSEQQKKWMSNPEKKKKFIENNNKVRNFYKSIRENYLANHNFISSNYLFCQEMIRLSKESYRKLDNKKKLTKRLFYFCVLLEYSKLDETKIQNDTIIKLVKYSKLIINKNKNLELENEESIKLKNELFNLIDKDLILTKHLRLSKYL